MKSGLEKPSSVLVSADITLTVGKLKLIGEKDGGGIRGYGSLLILRDLMNKIGEEEKRLDPRTESSFWPCDFKPTLASAGRYANEVDQRIEVPSSIDQLLKKKKN